jgi:hypothetical protein
MCSIIFVSNRVYSSKLKFTNTKNHIDLNAKDSIIYNFYLINSASTTIKFINIYGGNEFYIEKEKQRSGGLQEFIIYSDSLKQINPSFSSGVYFLQIDVKEANNNMISFNSFQEPWGKLLDIKDIGLNRQDGEISYSLTTTCFTKLRIGFENGSLAKTIINLAPESPGIKNHLWDGYDQTAKVKIKPSLNPQAKIISFAIPNSAFYLVNKNAPIDFTSAAVYPDNWTKFALNPFAKTAWNKSVDVPLNFKVSKAATNDISFNFEEQTLAFNNVFSSMNEIYISIDNEHIVENPNVMIPGQYTVAFPELGTGIHTVLVNIILPDNVVAAGTYQLKINN